MEEKPFKRLGYVFLIIIIGLPPEFLPVSGPSEQDVPPLKDFSGVFNLLGKF